jgi:hypothetical protein
MVFRLLLLNRYPFEQHSAGIPLYPDYHLKIKNGHGLLLLMPFFFHEQYGFG